MALTASSTLLAEDEPPPCQIENPAGKSPFLLICDHAGQRIPRRLGTLGVTEADQQRHIAWDIGAAGVTLKLAAALNATALLQRYSRLVIDCNRPLHSAESIVTTSERTPIPGNDNLNVDEIAQRQHAIFAPYHAAIHRTLDTRRECGQPTLLLALHSFTPVYLDQVRPWHIGLLYNRDPRLARALAAALSTETGLVVGDNEPYTVDDNTDYSIPEYGERRGLLHVEIEIRQDLIADAAGQQRWTQRLADLLPPLVEPLMRN